MLNEDLINVSPLEVKDIRRRDKRSLRNSDTGYDSGSNGISDSSYNSDNTQHSSASDPSDPVYYSITLD